MDSRGMGDEKRPDVAKGLGWGPWPEQLFDTATFYFIASGIIGSAYFMGKGMIQNPDPNMGRFASGLGLARANTLRVCCVSSMSGALFRCLEKTMFCVTGKEDPFYTGVSAAIAAAAGTATCGPLVAASSAAFAFAFYRTSPAEYEEQAQTAKARYYRLKLENEQLYKERTG